MSTGLRCEILETSKGCIYVLEDGSYGGYCQGDAIVCGFFTSEEDAYNHLRADGQRPPSHHVLGP